MAAMTDSRAVLLAPVFRAMSERDWQTQVQAWAKRAGWRYMHSWQSMHSPCGFPDLCMVRGDRLIFAELKREKGYTTTAQKEWLAELRLVPGIEVYVWKPSMEADVKRVLGLR